MVRFALWLTIDLIAFHPDCTVKLLSASPGRASPPRPHFTLASQQNVKPQSWTIFRTARLCGSSPSCQGEFLASRALWLTLKYLQAATRREQAMACSSKLHPLSSPSPYQQCPQRHRLSAATRYRFAQNECGERVVCNAC